MASRSLGEFAKAVVPKLELTDFYRVFLELLDRFSKGDIKKLMISVPPQHGKSLGVSNLLPAFMLGLNPDLKICIGSYSFSLARRFGMGVQRIIASRAYAPIFPKTYLKGMPQAEKSEKVLRAADEFEIIGAQGGLKLVGRECALTGSRVDVMVMDDLYKDAAEANSPIIRESIWDWYTSVVRTRMHNDSQEIIVFTRWHEDDLVGRIAKSEKVVEIDSLEEIELIDKDHWVKVNFEAIKNGCPTPLDPRETGQALWETRHSAKLLEQKRKLDPLVFEALYQGNPKSKQGLLYSEFKTYDIFCGGRVLNYTDTADTGGDKLCSICYAWGTDGQIYVLDVVYSEQPMEVTERLVAQMLKKHKVKQAMVESNSGGRGFARAVQRLAPECAVKCFHQSANKESRILTNASTVNQKIVMPYDWKERWSDFAEDLNSFRRVFKANRHDDAADAITGIVECESEKAHKKIQSFKFA